MRCTSGGSNAIAWFTRFVTLTVLRSGSVPTAKVMLPGMSIFDFRFVPISCSDRKPQIVPRL